MTLFLLFQQAGILGIVIFLVALVAAITVHEFAHAWVADLLGDDTPGLMGRVTLNPLAHLDPIGSIAFLVFGFGWGKPVIYNPLRLSHKVDELWIALAGPASNILLAIFLNFLTYLTIKYHLSFFNPNILQDAAAANVLLASFNMLPIPPLDGSAIIAFFWPDYRSLMGGQIGLVILLLIIFSGILGSIITPVLTAFAHLTTLYGAFGFSHVNSMIFGTMG